MPQTYSDTFAILPWEINKLGDELSFHFHCSTYGAFVETIKVPVAFKADRVKTQNFHNLAALLSCSLAVSYYKLKPASNISIRPAAGVQFTDMQKRLITAVFGQGLGEFYARNALSYPPKINIKFDTNAAHTERPVLQTPIKAGQPIIAFGGGKDSNVSLEIVKQWGMTPTVVSVVLSSKTQDKLSSMSSGELTFIGRKLDKKLFELNTLPETLNGHIPITAINSLILSLYALAHGHEWVVFSNERGSSQFTRIYQGEPINHQYSKSLEFESLLVGSIAQATDDKVSYFSLLRPFSELWIGKAFSTLCTAEWTRMASCNRNFIFHADTGLNLQTRWCGQCSKCVYTSLIIAPFIDPLNFETIFEQDLLNTPSNIAIVKSLTGLGDEKPWECVGDITDTRAVVHKLSYDEKWKDKAVLSALRKQIDALQSIEHSRQHIDNEIALFGPNHLPKDVVENLRALKV